jgi:hypothetical protein
MIQLCQNGTTVSFCRGSFRGPKVWTMDFRDCPYIVHTVTYCLISICRVSPFSRKNIVHPKTCTSKGFTELWTIWTMFERFSIHQYYTQYYSLYYYYYYHIYEDCSFIFLVVHSVHNARKQAPAIPSRLFIPVPIQCPYIVHT